MMDIERAELADVWPPTPSVSKQAGHEPISPVKAIRLKCLDCSNDQPSEVAKCVAVKCPLWPFRAGKHPYTKSAYARDEEE